MNGAPVVWRSFLAAVCVFAAALNRVHGQTELYGGISESRFALLRSDASATGYEFGCRFGVLSWLALDAGYTDFGKVNGAFPLEGGIYLPGAFSSGPMNTPLTVVGNNLQSGLPTYFGSGGPQTTGPDSLHVDARAVYFLPELRYSFGSLLSGSLGFGLARFESKIGSNFYQSGMIGTAPGTWWETYSGTRRSWTSLGRASLRAAISRSWTLEASAHFTSAPAFSSYYVFGGVDGRERLQVLGVALDLIWRFPSK